MCTSVRRAIKRELSGVPIRVWRLLSMRRLMILAVGAAAAGAVAPLGWTTTAWANSDPHRVFATATPFDLPASYCGFPVHVGIADNREYETVSTLADGSTVIKTTGSFAAVVTNESSGHSRTVNASGPGTITLNPDGVNATIEIEGLGLLYAANGTAYGLPSDLVVTSGLTELTSNLPNDTITGSTFIRAPHVVTDLCADLAQ